MSVLYAEEDMLMISGIQHFGFCRRQWGLIHIEQQWAENVLTIEGKQLHRKADDPSRSELRGDVLVSRAMPLVSSSLGMYGVADVIEFHAVTDKLDSNKVKVAGRRGWWLPYPVEYKRGNRKDGDEDELQLCAQAVALEDMLGVQIQEGALYYGERERRVSITFHQSLRERVRQVSVQMHQMFAGGTVERAVYEPKCKGCSLIELCNPTIKTAPTRRYLSDYLMNDSS